MKHFTKWINRAFKHDSRKEMTLVMGARYEPQTFGQPVARNQSSLINNSDAEKYFRPSRLPIKNTLFKNTQFFDSYYEVNYKEIKLPATLTRTPDETILNYFSILREAENLTQNQLDGCGTVGMAKLPFPIAYNFFTKDYHKTVSYNQYLQSFAGIGHLNLIKMNRLPGENGKVPYFIELESIEGSSKGVTYFAYYYGYLQLKKEQNLYKIDQMKLYGEDFLCAAYHLWQHDAEALVAIMYGEWCKLIKKQLPAKQDGYVKIINFIGTDGADYRFIFYQLTNDTDVLVSQYKKNSKGNWESIRINPSECLKN
ncbi:hypothetical protein ACQCU1_15820 [Sutcliffiella horikoshii]|uniref:Uncharacterized protein n=1 Tax=Sutcliffiella horikoshii TaxID=79883 RepID=A0AA95B4Y0_9BACI|nr:hypothetical protein [Sutcliffiella horikoshii]TYS57502.1 hypothetical protein FZC74_15815 [Sutcliffiella horikoshii]